MNRFQIALHSLHGTSLSALTQNLFSAVVEAEAYGCDPTKDAAVLLLNMQLSFMTNVDLATLGTYDQIVSACQTNAEIPLIDSTKVH